MKPKTRAIVYAVIGALFAMAALNVMFAGGAADAGGEGGARAMGQQAGVLLIPGLFLWRAWVNWNSAQAGQ